LNVSELNVTEDLNITEKNFTEELNVSEHEEFVTKQSKQKFDDDVFINVLYHLTAALPSSLIEGTQFEDPLVIFPLETSQVIEAEEVLEKHDVPVQEEDVRKIADALYDERIVMQIKTEMKSNEGETPEGMCLVAIFGFSMSRTSKTSDLLKMGWWKWELAINIYCPVRLLLVNSMLRNTRVS
jgi:hypothetical protein